MHPRMYSLLLSLNIEFHLYVDTFSEMCISDEVAAVILYFTCILPNLQHSDWTFQDSYRD